MRQPEQWLESDGKPWLQIMSVGVQRVTENLRFQRKTRVRREKEWIHINVSQHHLL